MAHYVVHYKGNDFLNAELARNYLGTGLSHKEFQLLVKTDPELFETILDELFFVYPLDITQCMNGYIASLPILDLDEELKKFDHATKQSGTCIKASGPSWELNGFRFVRFSDILDVGKYRNKNRYPHIKMCGNIYVALDAKIKDVDGCYYVSCSE